MRSRTLRTRFAAMAAAGVTALATAVAGAVVLTPAAHAAPGAVSGVQFRWGFNNETNNSAFSGGFNFFSAGKLGNPGSGSTLSDATAGATWSNGAAAGWTHQSGNVYIEKQQADGSYAGATWLGTKTDKDGVAIGSPTSPRFSGHQVVIDGGEGVIDPEENTADIVWDGDFTVVYYSGLTFFYVSDPALTIREDGTGEVKATLSGYSADRDNPSIWSPLPDTVVTLATLENAVVTANGVVTTPKYLGVEYNGPDSTQVRSGDVWGSFPQDFVEFQEATGQATYWYSSGGSADRNKLPLPLTVTTTPLPHVAPGKASPEMAVQATEGVYGKTGTVTVTVDNPWIGPTGTVTLTGAGQTLSASLSGGTATFTLPASVKPGSYPLTASYSGDGLFNASSAAGSYVVGKAATPKPKFKVTKSPGPKKAGKAKVTVKTPVKGEKVGGKVKLTLTLKKPGGKPVKVKVNGKLKKGKVTLRLPALAPGTWKVQVVYVGNKVFAKSAKKFSITVR